MFVSKSKQGISNHTLNKSSPLPPPFFHFITWPTLLRLGTVSGLEESFSTSGPEMVVRIISTEDKIKTWLFCKYLLWKFMTVREWVELLTKLLLLRLLQLLLYRLVGLTTVLSLSLCGFSFWSITNSSCLGRRENKGHSQFLTSPIILD